jgi:hypothetical protein
VTFRRRGGDLDALTRDCGIVQQRYLCREIVSSVAWRWRASPRFFVIALRGMRSRRLVRVFFHELQIAWPSARRQSRSFIAALGHVIIEATTKIGGCDDATGRKNELIVYENVDTAPIVYFDIVPAHGVMGGAIQIELACRILDAIPDGNVEIKFVTSGRLRCSATAALNLRNAIDASLKMLEQPQQAPAATAKLNRGLIA